MRKKLLLLLTVVMFLFPSFGFADPGDTVPDHQWEIWRIATNANDLIGDLVAGMNTLSDDYRADSNQSEWAYWLKYHIALSFSGKVFYNQVYKDILSKIVGYNYRAAKVADEYAAPTCSVNGTSIECAEDPTGAERTVLLYRYTGGEFVEQNLTGTLDAGIWSFTNIPSGTGSLTLAYDDEFASFPCVFLAIP